MTKTKSSFGVETKEDSKLDKYDGQYKMTDLIKSVDKKEADKLITKPKVSIEKSRLCFKGSFKKSTNQGGAPPNVKHHQRQP